MYIHSLKIPSSLFDLIIFIVARQKTEEKIIATSLEGNATKRVRASKLKLLYNIQSKNGIRLRLTLLKIHLY